tara:strand:- start:153 stop:440 length:288 start_codon:yes stop_codon:yes gene_type:complete
MGNYTTQPEFATEALVATPSDTINNAQRLNKAALYIGTGGDVKVILADVNPVNGGDPTAADGIVFKNIPDGSFLPVICDYLLLTGTTAADIVTIK